MFFIRGGRLIGRDHFCVKIGLYDKKATILNSFIKQFYSGTPFIPRELMLEVDAVSYTHLTLPTKRIV